MISSAASLRVLETLGVVLVLLGGGIILDADQAWLGWPAIAIGGCLMTLASRSHDVEGNAS
jgi:hypothetical protein